MTIVAVPDNKLIILNPRDWRELDLYFWGPARAVNASTEFGWVRVPPSFRRITVSIHWSNQAVQRYTDMSGRSAAIVSLLSLDSPYGGCSSRR
jgi:hypothetical protein